MSKIRTLAVGVVNGIPMEKIKACMRMDDLSDEILDRLYDGKAVPLDKVRELNELFYKTFPERQDGGEFTREEPAAEPKAKAAEKLPEPDGFGFGVALEKVKAGGRCSRKGWNGKGQYITLGQHISYETNYKGEKEVFAYHKDIGSAAIVFMGTRGAQVGWLASQADMLAEDWYEVEG